MRIDLTVPAEGPKQACFGLDGAIVHVVGADKVVEEAVRRVLDESSTDDIMAARNLYRKVPGHYAVVIQHQTKTIALTDPYSIIKLYLFRMNGRSILADDPEVFYGEEVSLETEALKYFFVRGYTPARHTFFKEINKLEPCSYYSFESGCLISRQNYGRFGNDPIDGEAFLDAYLTDMEAVTRSFTERYGQISLFLSGGMDSTFLYKLLGRLGADSKVDILVGYEAGLGQSRKIDKDFDVEFARRITAADNRETKVVSYDMLDDLAVQDFQLLRKILFCDYALAFTYMGITRSVLPDQPILNGQNADSVLSFGSMGSPRFQKFKLAGLYGYFSRYFWFYGESGRLSLARAIAVLLRRLYYRRTKLSPGFSKRNLLLGLGLHPENKYYDDNDPAFSNVDGLSRLTSWFEKEYVSPLLNEFRDLTDHAQALVLYNWTYMQGAANRSAVMSAVRQGRSVFLPYATLHVLELMTRLTPHWRFAFHGKYPNTEVGKRIGVPDFVMRRCDPNDADSTDLLYRALTRENSGFRAFLQETYASVRWSLYRGILSEERLARLKNFDWTSASLPELGLALRVAWVDLTLREFKIPVPESGST
jgi:asparagine synthetase B (glutamine-hydrolysing)